jgi:hypothetical protein
MREYRGPILLWDPIGSQLHEKFIGSAMYADLDLIIEECDLVLIQNSNEYFSSEAFVDRLKMRKSDKHKLMIYQLWNCLPEEMNDSYHVVSLSNFRHLKIKNIETND